MRFETLAAPVRIGSRSAPNRIVNHPMECNDADTAGNPTDLTLQRYLKLAEGGAGIINVESMTVSALSRARKNQLQITEKNAEHLAHLVKEMKAINPDSLIIFQINHSGNVSGDFSEVVSYYPTYYPLGSPKVRILMDEDIEEIKGWFVQAAVIAHQAGADGIDFKQCHGYLGGQLLRPANTKAGRYGGSFQNRTRFFRETAQEMKAAINDKEFLLSTRISVYEGIPGGFGTAGPNEVAEDLSEPLAFCRMIEEAGFHFINVSGGIPVMTAETTRPTKNYPAGIYRQFGWAKAVRGAVRIPLIGSAYSYLKNGKNRLPGDDTEKKSLLYWAEKNIRDDKVDMVGIGRQSLADPLFAKKVLAGEEDKINFCTTCGGCSNLLRSQARVGCAVYSKFYKEELRRVRKEKNK
jgi:2,4-dienoyl-CoA reductase-like NADH-dependent reductase (Old Yellow Enzyme family)